MANSFKDIVVTPNIANSADPKIVFNGANATVNATISLFMYPTANGTLSFEGTAGQLFSITNDLSNSIFAVSDISGIPAMEAFANGQVNISGVYGNVSIGSNSIARSIRLKNRVIIGNEPAAGDFSATAPLQIQDNTNSYSEMQLSNENTGTSASGDLVITDDSGNSTQGFIDLGINGSGFNDANFTIVGARGSYLYTQNSSIVVGTADPVGSISLFAGSTLANSAKLKANATFVLISNSTSNVAIFNANGTTTLANATIITGPATLSNSISVAGATTLSATLAVTGNTTFSNNIKLAAGSTAVPPLTIPTGTVSTTVTNGSIEYTDPTFYAVPTNSRRAAVSTPYIWVQGINRLATAQIAAQGIFGAAGTSTLAINLGVGRYRYAIRARGSISAVATTVSYALGGTATLGLHSYTATTKLSITSSLTAGTTTIYSNARTSAFTTLDVITAASTAAANFLDVCIDGIIDVTAAGTVIFQHGQSAATAAITWQQGSFVELFPYGAGAALGAANTNIGAWA